MMPHPIRRKIRIGLIGASGRLGSAIAALAKQGACSQMHVEIACSFDQDRLPFPDAPVDLFLDVSLAAALPHNLKVALEAKKPLVIGTTGHTTLKSLEEAASALPIFYSPNFSRGMAWMHHLARKLAQALPPSAHIDLLEAHHSKKQDKPSGSAKSLAQIIESLHPSKVHIHSIRSGTLPGEHTLYFNTEEERLVLSHQAHSPTVFAKGALDAAEFLVHRPPGFYGMEDLILAPSALSV